MHAHTASSEVRPRNDLAKGASSNAIGVFRNDLDGFVLTIGVTTGVVLASGRGSVDGPSQRNGDLIGVAILASAFSALGEGVRSRGGSPACQRSTSTSSSRFRRIHAEAASASAASAA